MLNLITDRAQADVDRYNALRTKILNAGWDALTPDEQAEWQTSMKGRYEHSDLNRVGTAAQEIAELLNGYGYLVSVNPKTNWVQGDVPTITQMETYISIVQRIKDLFYGTTELPAVMEGINHEDANNIERLLKEIEMNIYGTEAVFRISGTFTCGNDSILQTIRRAL